LPAINIKNLDTGEESYHEFDLSPTNPGIWRVGSPVPEIVDEDEPPAEVDITHFDGEGMYAEVEPLPAIAKPRLIVEDSTTEVSTGARFMAGRHSGNRFYLAEQNGNLLVGHGSLYVETIPISDGLRRRYEMYIDGDQAVVEVDGVEVFRGLTDFNGDLSGFIVARHPDSTGGHWKGPMPLVQVNDGKTVVRRYTFKRRDSVIENEAPGGELGAELHTGISDLPLDQNVTLAVGMNAGATYLLNISGLSDDSSLRFYEISGWGPRLSNGLHVIDAAGTTAVFREFGRAQSGVRFSIRRAPGWGRVHNMPLDAVRRYRVDDGDLIGVDELVTQNSITTWDGSEADWASVLLGFSSFVGEHYRIAMRATPGSTGRIKVDYQLAGGEPWFGAAASLEFERIVTPVDGKVNVTLQTEAGSKFVGTISVGVRRAIPASPLYKLRRRIEALLKNRAGKVRPIPYFDGVSMKGRVEPWTATSIEITSKLSIPADIDIAYLGMHISANSSLGGDRLILWKNSLRLYVGGGNHTVHDIAGLDFTGLVEIAVQSTESGYVARIDNERRDDSNNREAVEITLDSIGGSWPSGTTSVPYGKGYRLYEAWIDLDAPLTNSRLYLMDSETGILYDALADSGANIAAGLPFAAAGNGVVSENTLTATADSWAYIYVVVPTEPGKTYAVRIGAETSGGESWYAKAWDAASLQTLAAKTGIDSGDTAEFVFTATDGPIRVFAQRTGNMATGKRLTLSILDVREAPNAGAIENPPADAYPKFVYQGDHVREWLSPERLSNADFSEGAIGWALKNVDVVNGVAQLDATVDGMAYVRQSNVLTVGQTYRGEVYDVERISGALKAGSSTAYNNLDSAFNSDIKGDFIAENANFAIYRVDGSALYNIGGASVRELLKEAV